MSGGSLARNLAGGNIVRNCQICTKLTKITLLSNKLLIPSSKPNMSLLGERMPNVVASARDNAAGLRSCDATRRAL